MLNVQLERKYNQEYHDEYWPGLRKYVNDFSRASSSNAFFFCFLRSRSGRGKLSEKQNQLLSKEVIT